MPRYLTRKIAGGDRFASVFLRMEYYKKFDIVQLFFEADCTLIGIDEVQTVKVLSKGEKDEKD